MSTISKSDLLANPKLLRLADPQSAIAAGIQLPEKTDSPSPLSTKPTLKDAFAHLTPVQKKKLKGTESKQHAILVTWLAKHAIPHIHAPTSRRVHDLPIGWPDFTIFRRTKASDPLGFTHALFIEIKVPGGVFSWEQRYWQERLPVHIATTAFDAMKLAASFYSLHIPALNQQETLLP